MTYISRYTKGNIKFNPHVQLAGLSMVRSALFSRHHADAASEWTNHDAWFRSRMVDRFDLDDNSAEKMSRFILSLFMANEIDYSFERQLFKYYKIR